MRDFTAKITENKQIADGIYSMTFCLPEETRVRAGQFAQLSVGGAHLLRRPLAVCKTEGKKITVCYQVKGEGTKILSAKKAGEEIDALLPLGNGFFVADSERKVALVGGGAGVFPMISALREYAGKKEIHAYIGFRGKSAVCGTEEFERADKFVPSTDDGSFGEKANAVQTFAAALGDGYRPDVVLSCGPLPMLRTLKKTLSGTGIPCFVSLEERMGCGLGACLVCVCDKTDGTHARVCKDGPVFAMNEIEL